MNHFACRAGQIILLGLSMLLAANASSAPSSLTTIVQYHMDEPQWTGASGEVIDSSGNNYNATAMNGATTAYVTPALVGNPGTCGYGTFNGINNYVALPNSFPNLTTDFTITAWIRTSNNTRSGQRILIDDQNNTGGYGFSLGDGGTGTLRFYARGSTPIILDTSNVINNNTWYFVAAVAHINGNNGNNANSGNNGNSPSSRTIYVYSATGSYITSATTPSSGWGTDTGAASIGGENNNSTETGPSFHFYGSIDEPQIFNSALDQTDIAALATQTHPCANTGAAVGSFNAYDSTTAAGATSGYITTKISGSAFNLDLVALNAARTALFTTFTGAVKVDLLDSSGGGTLDSNGCNANWPVIQTLATNPVFVSADNGRHTVSITENNAWPNARVRVTYPATGAATAVGCSNDNFAIRPYTFAVSVSDANWNTAGTSRTLYNTAATGGNVHKAGQPFSISATAYNAAGGVTSNYAGSPSAALSGCQQPAAGCTLGSLQTTTGTGVWSAASGTVTSNSASYSDAGAFTMQLTDTSFASVDANDGSSPAQLTIASQSFNVGRFVPDHFDLAPANTPTFSTFNSTDSLCRGAGSRSFTYIGQSFAYLTAPQASIYARNASGATTVNYSNALWHGPVPLASYTSTPNLLDTSLTSVPTVSANNNGTCNATVNASDLLTYTRSLSTPQNPFNADIALTMSVSDSSESAVTGNGVITTSTSAVFNGSGSGIAFDSGNTFRYGRLALNNASGAETLNLPVPLMAQYWNGSNFITNTADNCTRLAASNITMANYSSNLAPCATALSLNTPLVNGLGNLKLLAPGANHNGSVDLTVNLQAAAPPSTSLTCLSTGTSASAATAAAQSYLQGKWSGTIYNVDPVARATFGIYKNANEFIFMRELY